MQSRVVEPADFSTRFRLLSSPTPWWGHTNPKPTRNPILDRLAEIVQGLKLDATLCPRPRRNGDHQRPGLFQGREHLIINANSDKLPSPLVVVGVLPAKVTLRGGDKDYVLGYPDQFALSHKPRNSPVRALSKTTVANPAGAFSRSDSAPRTRRSRGSRMGNP